MVVVLLILRLGSTYSTFHLPTLQPGCAACLSVHLPTYLLASPLLYSKGKGTFSIELLPF